MEDKKSKVIATRIGIKISLENAEASEEKEEYLYHYTSAAGLIGIVKNRELWATGLRFLNDQQEGVFVHNRLVVSAEQHHLFFGAKFNERQARVYRQTLNASRGLYVSSLSKHPKSLTQYRMYGPPNGGYCIGFPRSYLEKAGRLVEVSYGTEKREKWVRQHALTVLGRAQAHDDGVISDDELLGKIFDQDEIDERCFECAKYKAEEFAHEGEVRILVAGGMDTIHLRPSADGSLLIPYVKVQLPDEAVLVKIYSGPNRLGRVTSESHYGLVAEAKRSHSPWRFEGDSSNNWAFRSMG